MFYMSRIFDFSHLCFAYRTCIFLHFWDEIEVFGKVWLCIYNWICFFLVCINDVSSGVNQSGMFFFDIWKCIFDMFVLWHWWVICMCFVFVIINVATVLHWIDLFLLIYSSCKMGVLLCFVLLLFVFVSFWCCYVSKVCMMPVWRGVWCHGDHFGFHNISRNFYVLYICCWVRRSFPVLFCDGMSGVSMCHVFCFGIKWLVRVSYVVLISG